MLKFKGSGASTPCPTATTTTGHMDILPGFKLCRKKLHQYLIGERTCPDCRKQYLKEWRSKNKKRTEKKDQKYRKKYYKKHKEKLSKQNKEWKLKNRQQDALTLPESLVHDQTFQGALPDAHNSSRYNLSRIVSIGCQKPLCW